MRGEKRARNTGDKEKCSEEHLEGDKKREMTKKNSAKKRRDWARKPRERLTETQGHKKLKGREKITERNWNRETA